MLNITEYGDKSSGKTLGLFFLDAEKAFDNVNWQFMKKILHYWKFGDKCSNAINKIYSAQTTAIRINNKMMDEFPIQKGKRQGCPISPLLFEIVLEVLLREIQSDEQFRGVKIKNYYNKYRAFVDDNVLFFWKTRNRIFVCF